MSRTPHARPSSLSPRPSTARPLVVVALGLALLAPTAAFARGGGGGRGDPAKMEQRIGRFVDQRLAPQLELSANQSEQLKRVLVEQRQAQRAHREKAKAAKRKLAVLLDEGASDTALQAQVTELKSLHASRPDRLAALSATDSFLSVEQQAQLILELPKARKHHRKMRREKRRQRGERGSDAR